MKRGAILQEPETHVFVPFGAEALRRLARKDDGAVRIDIEGVVDDVLHTGGSLVAFANCYNTNGHNVSPDCLRWALLPFTNEGASETGVDDPKVGFSKEKPERRSGARDKVGEDFSSGSVAMTGDNHVPAVMIF